MILLTHVLEFYVTIFNESLYPSQKDGNDESPPLAETLFSVDLSSFDGHDCLRYPWRWTEDNYFSSRLQIIWQSTITSSLTFDRFAVSQCIISLRVPSWPWNSVVSSPYRNRICPVSVFAGRSLSSCIPQCSTLTTRNKSSVNLTFRSKCCGRKTVGKRDGLTTDWYHRIRRKTVDLVWHHWTILDHL